MLSTQTTGTAALSLAPSLLDPDLSASSPSPRPTPYAATVSPRGLEPRHDEHTQQSAAYPPSITQHKSPLGLCKHRQTSPRPLAEYRNGSRDGNADSHVDQHVAQPRTAASPTRATTASSLASYLPASIRARLQSPGKPPQRHSGYDEEKQEETGIMALTGEGRKTRRALAGVNNSLGVTNLSRQQKAASEGSPPPEDTTPTTRVIRTSGIGPAPDRAPKSAGSAGAPSRNSLLNMFSRPPPAITAEEHAELLSLSVEDALFPSGAPATKDPFSPAAFKNLQTQATGLLKKMQTAYRQKAEALVDVEKDREAEREEVEEAETRAKHLKFQLEDMTHKATEQERRMQHLMDELAAERRVRLELERKTMPHRLALSPGGFQSEAGSAISEDLGMDEDEFQKRKWRKSNGTDTSFETDDDNMSFAESESVFSRPRSPSASTTTTTRGVETSSVVDVPTPQSMRGQPALSLNTKRASVASVASTTGGNRRSTQQMSTFQKLMKGISGGEGCPNCKGQDASMAWDTVGLLRDENKSLKHRVGELEDCLEGALDAVNGIGL